jgi:hypothetical protein
MWSAKLVRILFNDGSTHSGTYRTVDVGSDLVILSAPGKLVHFRREAPPVSAGLMTQRDIGIRAMWVGRL